MITLYHETTRTPCTFATLLRDEVLVRPYQKPEEVRGIIIPEMARADRTQTLWEVLATNARAEEALGTALPVGCIVQTLRRWPRDTHHVDSDGHPCFLLSVSHCGIRGVIVYDHD